MKKAVISVMGVLAIASLAALMSSCKKDCTCTITYTKAAAADRDSDVYMFQDYPANYDADNCKDLTKKLEREYADSDYYKDITCK